MRRSELRNVVQRLEGFPQRASAMIQPWLDDAPLRTDACVRS